IARLLRLLDSRAKRGEVTRSQQSPVAFLEQRDLMGNYSLVEVISSRHERRVPAPLRRALFCRGNRSKSAGQVLLQKALSGPWYPASRQKKPCACRPLLEDLASPFDVAHTNLVDRKPVCQLDRRCHHLAKRLGAKLVERSHDRVEDRGNGG